MSHDTVELPAKIEDPNQEAMVSFWWTSTQLKRAARKFFKEHGSSEADFNLLMALLHDKPLTQNDLSQLLLVDKSNITGLIDRLEKDGLVRRNAVPGDRRSYHVALTGPGRKFIEKLEALYARQTNTLMAGFTAAEREELIRLTRKLRVAIADSGL